MMSQLIIDVGNGLHLYPLWYFIFWTSRSSCQLKMN